MRIAAAERVTDIASQEQTGPQYGAHEINVMTGAASGSPAHRRKEIESLADMSKPNDDKT